MNLFSKEKGIIFSILNAILVIWIISAIIITVSNLTHILVKDYTYNYDEYKIVYCNLDYETELECKNNYDAYAIDAKHEDISYKRDLIIAISNVILVSGVLVLLNTKKTK